MNPLQQNPMAPAQGGAGGMMEQILRHVLDTHKHSLQQTGNINGGLLALLKQQSPAGMGQPQQPQAQPQAPAPQGAPMGGGI